MEFGRQHIGSRVYGRMAAIRNRLSRVRYFRGHGVHSPFVYNLVRSVFMTDRLLPGDRTLYTALLCEEVAPCRAVQLQNLAIHCACRTFALDRADADLCVVTETLPLGEIPSLLHAAADAGTTVALLSPYKTPERQALCRDIVAGHGSTSVDNRGYLLIFNNNLPKQHFRI